MSYQTGNRIPNHLQTDLSIMPTICAQEQVSKKVWEEIFIHKLGHVLGLEHPWDMKEGDTDKAVEDVRPPHTHTLMGYNNEGNEGGFTDIDLATLEQIWGATNAKKDQFKIYSINVGNEVYGQLNYIDGAGNFEVITSDTRTVIA